MQIKKYFITPLLMLLITTFLIINLSYTSKNSIELVKGMYNFTNLDSSVYLAGQWEFYPNKLICTNEENINNLEKKYINIPINASDSKVYYNYASYRAVLKDLPLGSTINISVIELFNYSNLYINGELHYSTGNLSKDNLNQLVNLKHNEMNYKVTSDEVEIVIELSDNKLGFLGINSAPILNITSSFNSSLFLTIIFVMSGLLFIIFYLLSTINIKNDKLSSNTLVFSIIGYNVLLGFYILTTYSDFSYIMSKNPISPVLNLYISRIALYLLTVLSFVITKSMSEKNKFKSYDFIIFATLTLFSLTPLFVSTKSFIINLLVFDLINLFLMVALSIYIMVFNNPKFKFISSIFFIAIIIGLVNDLFYTNNVNSLFNFKLVPVTHFLSILILITLIIKIREDNKEQIAEINKLKNTIKKNESPFLSNQIQSHFIYNTLNTIQALCYKNPERAASLIEYFSNYLRTRLDFNKLPEVIRFEDEIDNVKSYLFIERERFGNNIKYELDLSISGFFIPPLSIQPLVENSIKHGISKKLGGGTIKIKSYEEDDKIIIKIIDDGVGFDLSTTDLKKRIGTENIKQRLELTLNGKFEIESIVGVGTTTTITIPKNKKCKI